VLAVNPMPPTEIRLAHALYALPELFAGNLGQNAIEYFGKRPVPNFNLGEAVGLRGAASLLPLVGVWILTVILAKRALSHDSGS
jgi:hypothetical protein